MPKTAERRLIPFTRGQLLCFVPTDLWLPGLQMLAKAPTRTKESIKVEFSTRVTEADVFVTDVFFTEVGPK